jgi:hypothetical protein
LDEHPPDTRVDLFSAVHAVLFRPVDAGLICVTPCSMKIIFHIPDTFGYMYIPPLT